MRGQRRRPSVYGTGHELQVMQHAQRSAEGLCSGSADTKAAGGAGATARMRNGPLYPETRTKSRARLLGRSLDSSELCHQALRGRGPRQYTTNTSARGQTYLRVCRELLRVHVVPREAHLQPIP